MNLALQLLFALGLAYILAALVGQIMDSWLAGRRTVQTVLNALNAAAKQPDVELVHFIDWYDGSGDLRICCFQQFTKAGTGSTDLMPQEWKGVFTDDRNRDYTFKKRLVTCPACLFRLCVEIER